MAKNKIRDAGIGNRIVELWHFGYSGDLIAKHTGDVVTGRSILRYLRKHDIDTGITEKEAKCEQCGVVFKKARAVFRRARLHFCSRPCYWEYLYNPNYIRSVYGMRQARKRVRECGYFVIAGEVVHHQEGDTTNNDPTNLMVFKNQSDHSLWHKRNGVESGVNPIWPGK